MVATVALTCPLSSIVMLSLGVIFKFFKRLSDFQLNNTVVITLADFRLAISAMRNLFCILLSKSLTHRSSLHALHVIIPELACSSRHTLADLLLGFLASYDVS